MRFARGGHAWSFRPEMQFRPARCFQYLLLNGGTLMFSQHDLRNMIAAAAIVLALAVAVRAADPFTLTSTTFKDGQMMPRKVANNLSANPNCVGENVSPQLSCTVVPDWT